MTLRQMLQPKPARWIGAIGATLLTFYPLSTRAQIAGDGTLGTQVNGSLTAPCTIFCTITNGATRGGNLFHSFRQFSLPNGDIADFQTAPAIQNVIVRVTGVGTPFISNINGTIQTSNPANFFLLNPNGIAFGPGAALNIGGSFLATTANRMQFADGTEFRTTDPAPLLTISVPVGLQFGQAPGNIQLQGTQLSAGNTDSFSDFAIVGGDVTLDNSTVRAPGQRMELAGVGENGTVGLQLNGGHLSLSVSTGTPRRDITLANGSIVSARASNGGGEEVVTGRNIILDQSSVVAGISRGINNSLSNQAGDITIDATVNLQLTQGSIIENLVNTNATGQGGNISITAAGIRVRDGSAIGTVTHGNGNAGNVRVTANTIDLDGTSPNGQHPSGIFSQVSATGRGRGGNVTLETGSLTMINGANISVGTFGNGNGGNLRVTANTIDMDGTSPDGQHPSGIFSQVFATGRGRGGDITLETGSLTMINGAELSADTGGTGNAGNVRVTANTIALGGTTPKGRFLTAIASQVGPLGKGGAGDITLETGSLTVTQGEISSSTFGNGNAGNLTVTAQDAATFDGPDSIAGSTVEEGSVGRGGHLSLTARTLSLTNGGQLQVLTRGEGDAGSVIISTRDTLFMDGGNGQGIRSGILSSVESGAVGNGGDIWITTGSLNASNGAGLIASTSGKGNAGNVIVRADNTISFDGRSRDGFISSIASEVDSSTALGKGGNISVTGRSLVLTNGAQLSSRSIGQGTAGNIEIEARSVYLDTQASLTAETASGNGGNIALNLQDLLLLRHNSLISATAGTAQAGGDGGNITIQAPFVVGVLSENSDIVANAFRGRGGNITINTNAIYGLQFQPQLTPFSDITASSQFGINGTVAINTLNLDPSRGLAALPVNLTDPSQQISQSCTTGSKTSASSFVSTGRGGIPLNPDEPLESRAVVTQWVQLPEKERGVGSGEKGKIGENFQSDSSTLASRFSLSGQKPKATAPAPFVEAQGWIIRADGGMELVADSPTANPASFWLDSRTCQTAQER